MKKYIITGLLALLLCITAFAQKETRNVGTFTGIGLHIPAKLYITQGSPQKVEVEGSKDLIALVKTEVNGSKLDIEVSPKLHNFNWGDDEVVVYVTVEKIENITVSGSGYAVAQTTVTSDHLDLKVSGSGALEAQIDVANNVDMNLSGSGKIELKGKCKRLDTHVSGSGRIKLDAAIATTADFSISGSGKIEASGTASSVKASISGSGKVLAADLETADCEIKLSGSGNIEINVKNSLDAQISGSGSVSYKGNPSHVNSNASGSGHLRKM
jgi:hypothetical protein